MMLPIINETVTLFEHGEFRICIIETASGYDAWLSHKQYGIATFMFGLAKQQSNGSAVDFHKFCELVECNLEEYESLYLQDAEEK